MKRSQGRGRRAEPGRPAPIVGIEAAHDRMVQALAQRGDRFSELLSRAVRDERQGSVLWTTSVLTHDEHEELADLTPAAHEEFGVELAATIAKLRGLLTAGDPFYILAIVQDLNLFVPWGEYYEPTHDGLETRLELVAGLLATQPVGSQDRPTAEAVQAILDEIDHALLVNTLFNLTMRPRGGTTSWLRFASAARCAGYRSGALHSPVTERISPGSEGMPLVKPVRTRPTPRRSLDALRPR